MQEYSVLMTMFKNDNPDHAKLAIDSMLNQSIKTDDFVLICDGPLTSDLMNMLQSYASKEDCFHIVYLPKNIGLGAALRYGVPLCKHGLIARMDDDDVAKEDRCEKELLMFDQKENLSIVGSYVNEFDTDPNAPMRIKVVPCKQEDIQSFIRRRNPFNHSSVMFKKDDILKVGNYSDMRTNQDIDLWMRLIGQGYYGANIDEPLVNFRFNKGTIKRRKNINNIKLMIKLWYSYYRNDYCSLIDFLFVFAVQLVILVLPTKVLCLAYDKR